MKKKIHYIEFPGSGKKKQWRLFRATSSQVFPNLPCAAREGREWGHLTGPCVIVHTLVCKPSDKGSQENRTSTVGFIVAAVHGAVAP